MQVIERLSIELTNRCAKGCWFCYNHSHAAGREEWSSKELVPFIEDCAKHGTRAVSFGGGEPLEFSGVYEVLSALKGKLFRSLTSNGLLLDDEHLRRLAEATPEKIHLSIHFPERDAEVRRVIRQVLALRELGLRAGVNFLIARSNLEAARSAARRLRSAGIGNESVVYLPMRGQDTPAPAEIAWVSDREPFQSMTCLTECARSERFCSIAWDRTVAWCSYTSVRRRLEELTYRGLQSALNGLGLVFCGA